MNFRMVLVLGLVLLSTAVAAQQEEGDSPWSGLATLGYLATSGNTDNSNLNAGFELGYAPGDWAHRVRAIAIHAAENDVTSTEAYELGWKSELNLSESNFLFGRLDWRKDRFSSYDQQFSQSVGYGRRLLHSEVHKLNAELGAGSRQSDLVNGSSESEFILRGALDYTWRLSETTTFTQTLAAESGSANTYLESITALKARLLGDLALVASYTVKHNTDVLPGTKESDTFTALSLEYAF